MGHDLELRVSSLTVEVEGDSSRVRATFDARSLRVTAALDGDGRDPDALSPQDRVAIERDAAALVLEAHRFPRIVFESRSIVPVPGGWEVSGVLTLHGATRELRAVARRVGDRVVAEARLDQRSFGVKPFSALLGALKVRPEVSITLSVPVP